MRIKWLFRGISAPQSAGLIPQSQMQMMLGLAQASYAASLA
ncbi:hypothetical protein [Paenibacillus rhizoplanae]|uniref:Uncharacterized protein n=1 Tax=Paenibacillus rhizoplanae TaxID=1917181 RepID=A0ABW5F1D8_9BACL